MSEYPKEMYVSDGPIKEGLSGPLKRVVLYEHGGLYYAVKGACSLTDVLDLPTATATLPIVKWKYAEDISVPKKRPMTIFEFQDFIRKNNVLIKFKRFQEWKTATHVRFLESRFQETIAGHHYKLEDGTIGEFEVDA